MSHETEKCSWASTLIKEKDEMNSKLTQTTTIKRGKKQCKTNHQIKQNESSNKNVSILRKKSGINSAFKNNEIVRFI